MRRVVLGSVASAGMHVTSFVDVPPLRLTEVTLDMILLGFWVRALTTAAPTYPVPPSTSTLLVEVGESLFVFTKDDEETTPVTLREVSVRSCAR